MSHEHDQRMRRQEEALKLCFEGCKHMTTISTAAAAIVVAVYQEDVIDSSLLAIALSTFAVGILVSLWGLLVPTKSFIRRGESDLPSAFVLLFFSIFLFAMGVLTALTEAMDWSNWVAGLLIAIVGIVLMSVVLSLVSLSHKQPGE